MDETKKSKGRRVVIIENSPSKVTTKDMEDNTNGTDTENSETMTAVGLTVAEDVTHIAAQSVGETKHCTRKIQWVTHGEFTAERGRRQIQELISTCKYRIGWACSTEFMKKEDVIHSFHYIYRVSWSLSTAELPVASVYAIAYFTIKIRKNKPWNKLLSLEPRIIYRGTVGGEFILLVTCASTSCLSQSTRNHIQQRFGRMELAPNSSHNFGGKKG
ncbi:A-kinase anchor protein 14 [Fukomys damarensis]|uniref:A-kinase anchor protein 14 n=1 Tax=Fukomys damarensis TaxID=885580 RepID=A0A091CQ07_FUKDA|nr:A-kinase anchor protein 14 [Fukomys damarensis]